MRVLVVDDEKLLVKGIKFNLENDGYQVDTAYDGAQALSMVKEQKYDIIILDLMLPEVAGLEVCRKIRENSNVPVIMLTAKTTELDKVAGLDAGADDYITKPFSVLELLSRVRAVLRRSQPTGAETLSCGEVTMDPLRRTVTSCGHPVELTYKEFELLCYMMRNCDIVLSRTRLMENVWGFDFEGESRTVDMHIKTLRQKLGAGGSIIKTVRGVGYKVSQRE